jgi:hypothetical protein
VLDSQALSGYGPPPAAHGFLLDKAGYSERVRAAWARAAESTGLFPGPGTAEASGVHAAGVASGVGADAGPDA